MNKDKDALRQQLKSRRIRGGRVTVWVIAGISLALSIVGIFVLRLWIPGLILGVAAWIIGLRGSRNNGTQSALAQPHMLLSLLAVIVPVVTLAASLGGLIGRESSSVPRDEFAVVLIAQASGDFTVTHTVPAVPGADKATVTTVDATDEFTVSFDTDLSSMQFHAGIVQSNLGTQEVTCLIKINDEVVLEHTSDRRFVDCSTDLQTLSR